jgi:hypothetical protein
MINTYGKIMKIQVVLIIYLHIFLNLSLMAINETNDRNLNTELKSFGVVEIPPGILTVKILPVMKKVEPVYPKEVTNINFEDDIIVYIVVDKHGVVIKANILKGDCTILNKAVLEAVKKWIFKPYFRNGSYHSVQFLKIFSFPENKDKKKIIESLLKFNQIRLPNLINRENPLYPNKAKIKNLEDEVEIKVMTDIYGNVKDARIIKGKYKILNDVAINAVRKWKHMPYILGDIPHIIKYNVIIKFPDCKKESSIAKVYFRLNEYN